MQVSVRAFVSKNMFSSKLPYLVFGGGGISSLMSVFFIGLHISSCMQILEDPSGLFTGKVEKMPKLSPQDF